MSKSRLINSIFKVLGKALPYVCAKDSRAYENFKALPENLTISLGIFGDGEYLRLNKSKNKIVRICKRGNIAPNLSIVFKNRKSAKLVLLGKLGIAQSFARHDIMLAGNISTAIVLVRIIDMCEYYLFPRIVTYKFLPKITKQFSSFRLYMFCLFGKSANIKIDKLYFTQKAQGADANIQSKKNKGDKVCAKNRSSKEDETVVIPKKTLQCKIKMKKNISENDVVDEELSKKQPDGTVKKEDPNE